MMGLAVGAPLLILIVAFFVVGFLRIRRSRVLWRRHAEEQFKDWGNL